MKDENQEPKKARWIRLYKNFYAIKQLTNNEKSDIINSENTHEFYKTNRHSLTIYKSSEHKLFIGMEI